MENKLIGTEGLTGSYNILVGKKAGANITTQNRCICIGENTFINTEDGDNQVRIGNNCGNGADVVIIGVDANVWINRDIFEQILGQSAENFGDLIKK